MPARHGNAAAPARLRDDVVVRRVQYDLQAALSPHVRDGKALIITLGAPIKVPAQLIAGLTEVLVTYLSRGVDEVDEATSVLANRVRFRLVRDAPPTDAKVLTFVFSGDPEPARLADALRALHAALVARSSSSKKNEPVALVASERVADLKTYRALLAHIEIPGKPHAIDIVPGA